MDLPFRLFLNILSIVVSCLSVSADNPSFFNATIGPYAHCNDKAMDIEQTLNECYERCRKPPQPKRGYMLKVYQSDAKNGGPKIVECRRVTIEQTFTQTWLFATIPSEPIIHSEPATEMECRNTVSKSCPSLDCAIREPKSLTEEYHYASDTCVRKVFITAVAMPSSLTTDGIDMLVMPMSSDRAFKISDGRGSTSVGMYIWSSQTYGGSCPFLPATAYGCDWYEHEPQDKHFICARGGFVVTMGQPISSIFPKCDNMRISDEGIIFSYSDSDNLQRYSQRLSLTNEQYKQEDAESFRIKMNHVLANLDADLCMLQCETLSLEARMHRIAPRLLKVGGQMILLEANGTGISCPPVYGCRLSKPHVLCGSPPRIGIECTGVTGYWDPSKPYLSSTDACHLPTRSEKMIFTAGHHTYSLDDDLSARVPPGFMHGRMADMLVRDHISGLDFKKEDIDELRASWVGAKTQSAQVALDSDMQRNISAPGWSASLLDWPGNIAHYITHKMREVIAFIVVVIIILMTAKLMITIIYHRVSASSDRHSVVYSGVDREAQGQARWI